MVHLVLISFLPTSGGRDEGKEEEEGNLQGGVVSSRANQHCKEAIINDNIEGDPFYYCVVASIGFSEI
jgi:hypothetical protein